MSHQAFRYSWEFPKGKKFDSDHLPTEEEGWFDHPNKVRDPKAPPKGPKSTLTPMMKAILALDPGNEEHFTKAGLPRVEAIEAIGGVIDVTREQRDEAWAEVQRLYPETRPA